MAGTTTTPSAGGAPRKPQSQRKSEAAHPRLEERTREELYALAGELGIAGRADLTKAELIEAIRRR